MALEAPRGRTCPRVIAIDGVRYPSDREWNATSLNLEYIVRKAVRGEWRPAAAGPPSGPGFLVFRGKTGVEIRAEKKTQKKGKNENANWIH